MPDKLVLVMEYVQEGDLRNRLNKEPPLEPKTRQRIMLDIARGMRHLHRNGVLHRHLTSSNVLLAGEGQDLRAKINDFGMADMANAITTSGLSRILATPRFRWRPREQFNVELQQHTPGDFMKGDVYSFGVLCWETITDMEPWDGEGNTCKAVGNAVMKGKRLDIPRSISTGYSKLIEDCWKADPNSRPDFEDIEARLFSLCNESLTVDVKWGVKRGRVLIAVAAFLLLLCMAVYAGRKLFQLISAHRVVIGIFFCTRKPCGRNRVASKIDGMATHVLAVERTTIFEKATEETNREVLDGAAGRLVCRDLGLSRYWCFCVGVSLGFPYLVV
ncbi:unnamed protein product [Ectocarpus sp. 8 AP-2014]